MQLVFRELYSFITLAECLNYSKAAEKLYISQPGLSKMIASLETYCVNVSQLANKCGMKYTNGANTVTYFSAILF